MDKIEEVAQGRVWTGKDALSRRLVDAVGGLSRGASPEKSFPPPLKTTSSRVEFKCVLSNSLARNLLRSRGSRYANRTYKLRWKTLVTTPEKRPRFLSLEFRAQM